MKNSLMEKISGRFGGSTDAPPASAAATSTTPTVPLPRQPSFVVWSDSDFDRLINETWEAIHQAARSAPHSIDRPAPLTADDWAMIMEGDEIARRLIEERDMHRFRLHMTEYRERVLGMIASASV